MRARCSRRQIESHGEEQRRTVGVPQAIGRMNVQAQWRDMPGTGAARPGEEGERRLVERENRFGFEIAGQAENRLTRPFVQSVFRGIAFACETVEHGGPGISDENGETRLHWNIIGWERHEPSKCGKPRALNRTQHWVFHDGDGIVHNDAFKPLVSTASLSGLPVFGGAVKPGATTS
jgi:hypothetical protein